MQRILSYLSRVEGIIAVSAYAITCSLLLADVFSKQLVSQSIWGAQKMAVFGAIVAGILGLTIAVSNNAHLRATFADGLLPFGWADRLGDVITATIFAGLTFYAVQFVMESYAFKDRAEVIDIPLWPIQLVFPYAFGSAAVKHLIYVLSPDLKPTAAGGG